MKINFLIIFLLLMAIPVNSQIADMEEDSLPILNQQLRELDARINDEVNSATDLSSETTGVLPPANGGIGIDTSGASLGDMLYFDGTNWALIEVVAAGTASGTEIARVDFEDDVDGSQPATISGLGSMSYDGGTAELDTGAYKWTATSIYSLGGATDNAYANDSTSWDLFGSNTDDQTISFWAKFTEGGTSTFISQCVDVNNFWSIVHIDSSSGLFVSMTETGTNEMACGSTGYGDIDTNWHHYAFIKDGSKYALYYDGTQVCYTDDSDVATFSGALYVTSTCQGAASNSVMNLDAIVWRKYSWLIDPLTGTYAVPNVGKTSTVAVPTTYQEHFSVPGRGILTSGGIGAAPYWDVW